MRVISADTLHCREVAKVRVKKSTPSVDVSLLPDKRQSKVKGIREGITPEVHGFYTVQIQ
jgi:hypothetical protein